MRAAYLGPPGTNSHDALLASGAEVEPVALPTVQAVVRAVQGGEAEAGLVPLENSREGAVGGTLDALVFDAPDVAIVGEIVHRVTYVLVAEEQAWPDEVRTVHSHPQALGQCARFLAEQLPGAALVSAPSTADAVRAVMEDSPPGPGPHAAIGTRHAAALYGAVVLAEGLEDDAENLTRFAWIARAGAPSPVGGAPGRTALVFWGGGDRAPGWLVDCLTELSSRGVNLTRIESRPRRVGLGHYMFFCDLDGAAEDPEVAAAIDGLRGHCERVRILGSFPPARLEAQ
jgi:prephenate dehydratase